jgi:hypothetical protein
LPASIACIIAGPSAARSASVCSSLSSEAEDRFKQTLYRLDIPMP